MKLFISLRPLDPGTVVKVDGWLNAAGAAALFEACAGSPPPLVLDLSDLRDADPDGVAALHRLATSDATIVGASPYVQLLLHDQGA